MRVLMVLLLVLVVVMQYQLWFTKASLPQVWELEQELKVQAEKNKHLLQRNTVLLKEVTNLKQANSALEEQARTDLGMIQEGEVYYQIVPKAKLHKVIKGKGKSVGGTSGHKHKT